MHHGLMLLHRYKSFFYTSNSINIYMRFLLNELIFVVDIFMILLRIRKCFDFILQVTIEFPYLFAQSLAFVCITYPMIGYYWSAYKIFMYFYAFLCTLMYFTYLGMLLVAMTPSFPVAAILQSAFYTIFNLFGGFLIPRPVSPY